MSELIITTPRTINSFDLEQVVEAWAEANKVPDVVTDEEQIAIINKYGLPWYRSAAIVYRRNAALGEYEILLMHEAKVQVRKIKDNNLREQLLADGHSPNDWVVGDGGWNIPAGRVKLGASFEKTAKDEICEETGWSANIAIEEPIYIHRDERPSDPFIMPVFVAEADTTGPETYQTEETSEIGWFKIGDAYNMATQGLLRSPNSVINSLNALITKGLGALISQHSRW